MLGRAQRVQHRGLGISAKRVLQLQRDHRCAHLLGVGRDQEPIFESARAVGPNMSTNGAALNYNAVGPIVGVGILWCAHAVAAVGDHQADVSRGAAIAAQGVAAGAPACAECHAYNGASDGSGAFPRIAGQSAYYLAKQLRDYASGVRANAVMTPKTRAAP